MSAFRNLEASDCYIVETTVSGRIRRVVYPKEAPKYGLAYIQDGLDLGELSLAEAADLTETVETLAIRDGHWKERKPAKRGLLVRFMDWFLRKKAP